MSGLYGVLKPFDPIQAHRLNMGTKLETDRGKNLYEFWGDRIGDSICRTLEGVGECVVVNTASAEYFKAVRGERERVKIVEVSCEGGGRVGGTCIALQHIKKIYSYMPMSSFFLSRSFLPLFLLSIGIFKNTLSEGQGINIEYE